MIGLAGLPVARNAALIFGTSSHNHAERPTTVANLELAAFNRSAWQFLGTDFAYVGYYNACV